MTTMGTMRALDQTTGAIRVEDVYDTDIHDLWRACTQPDRLARWIAQVSGEVHQGGSVRAVFTSAWSGSARIDACDPPSHLLLTTTDDDGGTQGQIEAWLTAEGSGTRLVVEERGIPVAALPFYGAGWHAHLEDLGRSLAIGGPVHTGWSESEPASAWHARWTELTPQYEDTGLAPTAR